MLWRVENFTNTHAAHNMRGGGMEKGYREDKIRSLKVNSISKVDTEWLIILVIIRMILG